MKVFAICSKYFSIISIGALLAVAIEYGFSKYILFGLILCFGIWVLSAKLIKIKNEESEDF